MLGSIIPSYKGSKGKGKDDDEVIREGDPRHKRALREIFENVD